MVDPVTIGYGTNKWLFDSNTDFISIFRPSNGTGTYSLHDTTDSDFLVPVGKKFIMLGMAFDTAELSMYTNTTPDTTSGGSQVWGQEDDDTNSPKATWIEFAASNYVNVYVSTGAGSMGTAWGIETTT